MANLQFRDVVKKYAGTDEALGVPAGTVGGIPVPSPEDFATAEQGAKADTAVQPDDLGTAASMSPVEVVTDPDAQAALSGAFVQVSGRVQDLPTPFFIAHRGGPQIAVENSMSAYRASVAQGAQVIEQDVRTLADGAAAVMHDATVDRTTDGSGAVADFNVLTWQGLTLDRSLVGNVGPTESPPLLEQVVAEFGGRVTLSPQAYDAGALAGIHRLVEAYGIPKDTILLQSNSPSDLAAAKALGYDHLMLISSNADPGQDFTGITGSGATMMAVPVGSATEAFIEAAHTAGLRVGVYAPISRYERDLVLGWGADFMFTDDVGYLTEQTAATKTDLFALQAPTSGFHWISGAQPGEFMAPDIFGWSGAGSGSRRLGYLAPTDPSAFTVTAEVRLADPGEGPVASAFLSIANTDFSLVSNNRPDVTDGYLLHLRTSGMFRFEEQVNKSRNPDGGWLAYDVAIPDYAHDAWIKVAVTTTATGVTVAFPDSAVSYDYPANTIGGASLPYICIGTDGATAFRNITVT